MSALNDLATAAFDDERTYADAVHMVVVYVSDPHPEAPDPSPYTGGVWERQHSERRQPRTHEERIKLAAEVEAMLDGNQRVLVDELVPRRSNPVWCTYGPMPNCAFLIDQSGVVRVAQKWVNPPEMKTAIDELLGE